ncbi:MAG: hypothetical protein JRE28_15695 [Deltaproteobacteria bacterium]|nr:hypothetical protein [Deltaproteobacteria bacterium]
MKLLIAIDDTDSIESRGTGQLAQIMIEKIEQMRWGTCSMITRHQLFVHEDIPYTSHNSAMCFEADIDKHRYDQLIGFGMQFLETESEEGSDPGLCVVNMDNGLNTDLLTAFGRRAKTEVVEKSTAYAIANDLGIHLSEHGGDGQGIVGALAGTGLRLTGNDGRFRGWFHYGKAGETIPVKDLLADGFVDMVRSKEGEIIAPELSVLLSEEKIKTVLQDHRQVVLVRNTTPACSIKWQTLTKKQVKQF